VDRQLRGPPVVVHCVSGTAARSYPSHVAPADDLWAELHEVFVHDDGSLPEFVLVDVPREALQPILDRLMRRGHTDAAVWDPSRDRDVRLTEMPDAGEAVAAGRVPSFHAVFSGIRINDVQLPPLGAFFVEDELALDYRAGLEWTPDTVAALARFLVELRALAPGAWVAWRPEGGNNSQRLDELLDRFVRSS
jgi:hypothetical protein